MISVISWACTRSIPWGRRTIEWYLPWCTSDRACCTACGATPGPDRILHAMRAALGVLAVVAFRHGARGALRVACRARLRRRADAFAERVARCTRAQYRGGVIRMDKGAALFDGVAISGTEAWVRAGGQRWVPGPMRVGGAGAV
jgi:hypothetical protein